MEATDGSFTLFLTCMIAGNIANGSDGFRKIHDALAESGLSDLTDLCDVIDKSDVNGYSDKLPYVSFVCLQTVKRAVDKGIDVQKAQYFRIITASLKAMEGVKTLSFGDEDESKDAVFEKRIQGLEKNKFNPNVNVPQLSEFKGN